MSYLIGLINLLQFNYVYFPLIMLSVVFIIFKISRDLLITNIGLLFFLIYGYLLGTFPLFFVYIMLLLIVVMLILPKENISGIRI